MTSSTTAVRTHGRRCVACNQPAEAWLCVSCAFNSTYYTAGFNVDWRSPTPSTIARRGLYPSPVEQYRDMPVLPALSKSERLKVVHERMELLDNFDFQWIPPTSRERKRILRAEANEYATLSAVVDANTLKRERAGTGLAPAHWNTVPPLDPRRWCDDCLGRRTHRAGCTWIELDGPYVGGYPNDGLRPTYQPSFKKLEEPGKHWQPVHHRQHRRAVARRWRAFLALWGHIGLDYFTRMLEANGKPPKPPKNPNPPKPKKKTKVRPRISKEVMEKIESSETLWVPAKVKLRPLTPHERQLAAKVFGKSGETIRAFSGHAFVLSGLPKTFCEISNHRVRSLTLPQTAAIMQKSTTDIYRITCEGCKYGLEVREAWLAGS